MRHDASKRDYLAVWLPYLATERLAAPDEKPLVVVAKAKGALRIAATSPAARRQGLGNGMTLADARARVPALAVADADPAADARLLLKFAESCEIFTPLVALDPPDGLMLDVTGCAHLFGGEDAMRRRVEAHFGITAKTIIAPTPDAAHALVRFGPSLPIAALELGPETTTALTRAGLKTLDDLTKRPSQILAARFGMALVTKLNRVLGHENIRVTPLRAPPAIAAEQHFPEPLLDLENLKTVLNNLCRQACTELERRGQGGRLFEAAFFRTDGKTRRIATETAKASRDPASLLRLLSLRLETLADPLDPGYGFDAIRLGVLRVEPFDANATDTAANELIDRLVARFGRNRVLRFIAKDSHDPRRAAALVPVASTATSAPWDEKRHRPLQLFTPPRPIEAIAEVPDGPPMRFRWRKVLHEVASAEGPERIAPEWWRSAEKPRDYYHVEDANGRRFWIYREGFYGDDPRWFLHGLFP